MTADSFQPQYANLQQKTFDLSNNIQEIREKKTIFS